MGRLIGALKAQIPVCRLNGVVCLPVQVSALLGFLCAQEVAEEQEQIIYLYKETTQT